MQAHFLEGVVSGESSFKQDPWYNPHGDCIEHKVAPEAIVADRIDDLLTLYRSCEDNRVIGYQIKGAYALAQEFGFDGLVIECEQDESSVESISVAAILLVAFREGPNTSGRRSAYAQTVSRAGAASIPREQLIPA